MAHDESLSQTDIDNLINNLEESGLGGSDEASASTATEEGSEDGGSSSESFGSIELDTLAELANISFGSASSTLSVTLNTDVEMNTPDVDLVDGMKGLDEPYAGEDKLLATVQYTNSFSYQISLILKVSEAKTIANMMLGNEGAAPDSGPLSDLELGGITEALSQMMTAAATSLTSLMNQPVEVNSPNIVPYTQDALSEALGSLPPDEKITRSQFILNIGGEGQTFHIMQLVSMSEVQGQIDKLMSLKPDEEAIHRTSAGESSEGQGQAGEEVDELVQAMMQQADPAVAAAAGMSQPTMASAQPGGSGTPGGMPPGMQPGMNPGMTGGFPGMDTGNVQSNPVMVQPVQFSSFDNQVAVYGEQNKNLELVMDVTLSLTVELGKTEISIKEILELTRGSVIELDRIAGEPVDLLANGKLIAKGEVVVIEDNFGLRITSIVSPAERLRGLG